MRCHNCKKPITEDMSICPNCGAYCSHVDESPVAKESQREIDLGNLADVERSDTHEHPESDTGNPNYSEEILGEIDLPNVPEEQQSKTTLKQSTIATNDTTPNEIDLKKLDQKLETRKFVASNRQESLPEEPKSEIEKVRNQEYENKIKSIPPEKYEQLCSEIKKVILKSEEISDETLFTDEDYSFTYFEKVKLIHSLYEELEEQGAVKKEQRPKWLFDNSQMVKEELSGESIKEMSLSFNQSGLSSEDRKIAQECWDEFEEETTHTHIISENEKHQRTSNQLFYTNLHPRTRSGKFTIILMLMILLILIFPNIENHLTPDEAQAEKKSSQEVEEVDEKSSDSIAVETNRKSDEEAE